MGPCSDVAGVYEPSRPTVSAINKLDSFMFDISCVDNFTQISKMLPGWWFGT